MQRNCLKCGHVNSQATGDALEECPGCGAIYSRVEASMAARASAPRRASHPPRGTGNPLSTPLIVGIAVGALALLSLTVYMLTQRTPAPVTSRPGPPSATSAAKPAPIVRTSKPQPAQPLAVAETPKQQPKIPPDEARKLCASASQLAKSIMTARQNNVPMAQAMELPGVTENEQARAIAHAMVIAAYEKPRFSTQDFIDTAITDFESEMYLYCIKAM